MRPFRLIALVLPLLVTLHVAAIASAQEVRTFGQYEVAVDFRSEPHTEVANAVVLRIRDGAGQPVVGVHDSVHVIIGTLGRTQRLPLRPVNNEPGVYEAPFIPPSPGRYTIELGGSIRGVAVSERIESGGGLPDVVMLQEYDWSSPGAYIAYGIVLAYLAGCAIMGGVMLHRKWRRGTTASF